jgi:hypothetical protein
MATVHLVLSTPSTRAADLDYLPVLPAAVRAAQTMTSSAASTASAIAAKAGEVWTVTAKGGDVYVQFDPSPDAGANKGYLVLSGTSPNFGAVEGQKCAIKDA